MALPDILGVDDLASLLPIVSVSWALDRGEEYTGLASGMILPKEYRSPLWKAKIALDEMGNDEQARIMALIESLDGSLRTFHLYDPRRQFPISDPKGEANLAAVTIGTIGSNNKSMSLSDLPIGFKVSTGDMLSFSHGSGPSTALHRICEDRVATELGNTSAFEVRPHIRPGAAAGMAVTLVRPYAEVMILPGTLSEQSVSMVTSTISFEAIQVI